MSFYCVDSVGHAVVFESPGPTVAKDSLRLRRSRSMFLSRLVQLIHS